MSTRLAEQTLLQAKDSKPNDPAVYLQLANFYNAQGDFDEDDRVPQRAHQDRAEQSRGPLHRGHLLLGQGEPRLPPRRQGEDPVRHGRPGSVDKAIAIKSDYMEAIAYKNLLLRLQANLEKDPKKQQALLKEADELRDKANELRKAKTQGTD